MQRSVSNYPDVWSAYRTTDGAFVLSGDIDPGKSGSRQLGARLVDALEGLPRAKMACNDEIIPLQERKVRFRIRPGCVCAFRVGENAQRALPATQRLARETPR